ncbi:MAG TPA: sn-glycerol-1-phosphate dehydrogenase [Planctomycetota bacterium]|jgi:glycerol-1-phosphate dehydrogenase [NAD(P)+]|nr:sn-glycerol-1-phosphate dehydrogenase [Planctomycetota bacterium]OQC20739.1 MAG: Glycerol-1-phosphate dehydrogenase (NAD(P)+) [Planctomycetes bacterium ADurb.Bin069]HNR98350.1 sn-glycerol-1-phosphate dehydrogenase [Planctomycetota bacterium]HNU24668.1 sn-glycerol-1-phosphate dehydrogenase [Planctomycetota bacterium]HOE28938.1 sn-glycerol-1-phosphate dehydrogenase [Planctomycetota bacterium]
MESSRIEAALAKAAETKVFKTGAGVLAEVPAVFKACFAGPAAVVADENTWRAAGARVDAALRAAGIAAAPPIVFPGSPVLAADYAHSAAIRDRLRPTGATPVAVGAGTINDLVKRAAFELGRRCMVAATAASVDGYSSFAAALAEDGFKKSMDCPAPYAIVADTEVLRAAPPAMTAAGYGDLAGKITAGADWIIADELGLDPIDPVGWDMVQRDLRLWLCGPGKLAAGDARAFELLFEGLTMSGFAMQALRKSRPASGAEHLFNHIWEMEGLAKDGTTASHGFCVAIGTLATAALMETVFAGGAGPPDLAEAAARYPTWEAREAAIRAAFGGTRILERVLEESRAKFLDPAGLAERLRRIEERWPSMRRRVLAQLYSYRELRRMFREAGCPVAPEEIGLTRERAAGAFRLAEKIRNRYTILDLAVELGILDACVERIFRSPHYLR